MADDWEEAGRVLVARWPSIVASWGREVIAGYLAEARGDGLSAERTVGVLRAWRERFPPTVPELLAASEIDPSVPTFEEAVSLAEHALSAPGEASMRRQLVAGHSSTFIGLDAAKAIREQAISAALAECHPLVGKFVETVGRRRLTNLLGRAKDEQWGEKQMREIREMWERCQDADGERRAARRLEGAPRRLDPLSDFREPMPALVSGDNPKGAQQQ